MVFASRWRADLLAPASLDAAYHSAYNPLQTVESVCSLRRG